MNKLNTIFLICPLLFSCNVEGNNSSSTIQQDSSSKEQYVINYTKKVDMTYTFTGDEKDKPGFGQGIIEITPTTSLKKSGYYLVYLANDYDLLTNYDEYASIEITGKKVSFVVKDGHYIPSEATKLAVFESNSRFLNKHPSIEKASEIIDIPENKILNPGSLQYKLGVTSDVHINFEQLGFGSANKWKKAMNFFYNNNVDNIIVTGDITGDTNLDNEYINYITSIEPYMDVNKVYEAIGNHGNTPSTISTFLKYTSGNDEIRPYENSPYYYVIKKASDSSNRDNMFIFMAQEIQGPSDSAAYDNFSKTQIDWLESVLNQYGNTNTNIFLIEHSPFLNWSPGDRIPGDYARKITFKESYTQTMRLKGLLETYKNVIMLTGHTHLTFYENENYSDQYDSFCRMIHVSSGTQTSSYNYGSKLISDTDGRQANSSTYGSEGYIVEIYKDYIIFKGYNISTNRIIPHACLILPTIAYGGSGGNVIDPTIKDVTEAQNFFEIVKGTGTLTDPYLISSEQEFKLLTDEFNKSTSTTESEMFGYGKYFKQTKDLDMTDILSYQGTSASGSTRYTFAGNYNGNGHSIKVNISGGGNQSVFPYTYGVISNLYVSGNIKGSTCAQVVRALYGKLINCIFDVNLDGEQEAGAIYSNYGYVYNLYTTGTHKTTYKLDPIAVNHNSTKYHNVFYYRTNASGQLITGNYGTKSNDLNEIVLAFTNSKYSEYNNALKYLNGYEMIEVINDNGKLEFLK